MREKTRNKSKNALRVKNGIGDLGRNEEFRPFFCKASPELKDTLP
jgi:hypothetical protein